MLQRLWMPSKFILSEPCRVKRLQMSKGVTLRWGLHYGAMPGEGVFFFRVSIVQSRPKRYRSLTSCLSICRQHIPQYSRCNSCSQHWSNREKQLVRTKPGAGECAWEMLVVREWFLMLQISPRWIVCAMCDILYTSSSFAHHLSNKKATSEVSASLGKTQLYVLFHKTKRLFSSRS